MRVERLGNNQSSVSMEPAREEASDTLTPALVLSGGGARAAYQAGVLQYVNEAFSTARFPVLSGVSAGSINTAYLANRTGAGGPSAAGLQACWRALSTDRIFRSKSVLELGRELWRRGPRARQALLDTAPLRKHLTQHLQTEDGVLTGVQRNVEAGHLKALALTTSNYLTGQTVTWVQGCDIHDWERPNRVGVQAQLTVDHVMASAALPLLFPAVQIGEAWYGDGGLRLFDPLAPAIHLGADALFVISTRYQRSRAEADRPIGTRYPSLMRMIGLLLNALFLDVLEHDAAILQRINRLLRLMSAEQRSRLRLKPIRLLVVRPSVDLGALAEAYAPQFDGVLKWIVRYFGDAAAERPDWLSMLSFAPGYIERLIEIGYEDGRRQHDRMAAFFDPHRAPAASAASEIDEL